MFGIGSKAARTHVDAFVNMIGEDEHSWGLSHKGYIWHNGICREYTRAFKENVETTVGIFFDGVAGTIHFYKDGRCLGLAFSGLDKVKEPLFPLVCSTAAKTEMSLGVMKRELLNLQDRCRSVIIRRLRTDDDIDKLRLPKRMKVFISEGCDDIQVSLAFTHTFPTGQKITLCVHQEYSVPVLGDSTD